MNPNSILALLALMLMAPMSFAEDREDPPVKRDANGERIWELTDYLKGTRFQIQDKMNGEAVRLTQKKDELLKVIASDNADLIRDRDVYVNRRKKDPDFVAAQKAVDNGEASLAAARANFDETTVERERNHLFAAKSALGKMTLDAVSAAMQHDDVQDDKKRLAAGEKDLARIKDSLERATKWRDELRTATRNTCLLEWPLARGRTGILGNIIVESRGVVQFAARETVDEKPTSEGIASMKYVVHPVRLVFIEPNDPLLQKPGKVIFDKTVVVLSNESDPKHGDFTLVKLMHADVDDLLESINANDLSHKTGDKVTATK